MKNIMLFFVALTISIATLGQTAITVEATPNPDGSITVSWDATYTELGPMYLTVSIAYSKKINERTQFSGVYSWYAYNPNNGEIILSGTRTVFPPPGYNSAWAMGIGIACSRTGPEMDDYECAPTVYSGPFKLMK